MIYLSKDSVGWERRLSLGPQGTANFRNRERNAQRGQEEWLQEWDADQETGVEEAEEVGI